MFANKEQEPVLLTYFPGNGAQVDGKRKRNGSIQKARLSFNCYGIFPIQLHSKSDFIFSKTFGADTLRDYSFKKSLLEELN